MNRIGMSLFASALFALASCSVSFNPVFDESAFHTAVAQTVSVGLTRGYASPTATFMPSLTFTASPTLYLPTPVPSFTETPASAAPLQTVISLPPSETSTPEIPLPELSVSVNTNCRSGPGRDFPIEGSLLVGESVKVYGVDPSGAYWYIANPDPGAPYCWLSGKYAMVNGAISLVPVFTPPPTFTPSPTATPQPAFRLTYVKMNGCGDWSPEIQIYNSGQAVFKSALYEIFSVYWGETARKTSNGFAYFDKCEKKAEAQDLPPEHEVTITAPGLSRNPKGKRLTFTATLCTEPDLGGTCLTRTINFTP